MKSPLTLQELIDIRDTLRMAEMEIVRPGTAAMYGYDLLDDVNDALYRLQDTIERDQADEDDGLDSEGYPLGAPREWSEDELAELRRREFATDNYGRDI